MASSSYYYSLMMEYSRKKRTLEEKKEKYVAYLAKLNNLNGVLPDIISSISNSNNSFLSGGYLIGEGVSLDNGKLKEILNKLDATSTSLSNVINNTSLKIEEFTKSISNYKNLYNEANSNYNVAKRAEMSG